MWIHFQNKEQITSVPLKLQLQKLWEDYTETLTAQEYQGCMMWLRYKMQYKVSSGMS